MAVLRDLSKSYQQNSDFQVRYVDPSIQLLTVRQRPLLAALVNKGLTFERKLDGKFDKKGVALHSVPTKDADMIRWAEKRFAAMTSTLADANFTGASVTVNVAAGTGKYFRANDIVRISQLATTTPLTSTTYADFRVSSVSTDALTMATAASVPLAGSLSTGTSGLYIFVIGNATAQGVAGPIGVSETEVTGYNYLQEFRHSFEVSDVEAGGKKLYSNLTPLESKEIEVFQAHLDSIEMALLRQIRVSAGGAVAAAGGSVFTLNTPGDNNLLGGFQSFVTTNVTDAGDNEITESEAIDFLTSLQTVGSANKIGLAGKKMINALQKFGLGRWTPQQLTGTEITQSPMPKISTMLGDLEIYHEPLFDDVEGSKMAGTLLVVDLSYVDLVYFSSPETQGDLLFQRREYMYARGQTAVGGEYRSRLSLKVANELAHGWLVNGVN